MSEQGFAIENDQQEAGVCHIDGFPPPSEFKKRGKYIGPPAKHGYIKTAPSFQNVFERWSCFSHDWRLAGLCLFGLHYLLAVCFGFDFLRADDALHLTLFVDDERSALCAHVFAAIH